MILGRFDLRAQQGKPRVIGDLGVGLREFEGGRLHVAAVDGGHALGAQPTEGGDGTLGRALRPGGGAHERDSGADHPGSERHHGIPFGSVALTVAYDSSLTIGQPTVEPV